jgi:NAD(P)H-hydrate epimerase
LEIGLHPDYLTTVTSPYHYTTNEEILATIKPRKKFAHKGSFGHVLTVGGSYGKIGAAILMSRAALRTGCGLVTAYTPKVGYTIFQTAFPECMMQTDEELYEIRNFPDTAGFDALAIGPGLGQQEYTIKNFTKWIGTIEQPCVLDADALNICSRLLVEHHDSFHFPGNCIITPHPKEFDRLAGVSKSSYERLEKQVRFAQQHKVIVVLKGAFTTIALPNGEVHFNSTGNDAMATAGSGDVLTGIIASLLAQGYAGKEAALLGVYLHGFAGDLLAKQRATLIASDLIEILPFAWKNILA